MLASSCCPHLEHPISLKAVTDREKSPMLHFEQDRLSHVGDPSKMRFAVVSPETRKDFVQGRSEALMVPGFTKVGRNLNCI